MLAHNTLIATSSTETIEIQYLCDLGCQVLVGGLTRDWKVATTLYYSRIPAGSYVAASHIQIEGDRDLTGDVNQVVLTARGLLRMSEVTTGDKLIQSDGQGAAVLSSGIIDCNLGMCAISASLETTPNAEGHLLIAGGFIVGDGMLNERLSPGGQPGAAAETDSVQPPA